MLFSTIKLVLISFVSLSGSVCASGFDCWGSFPTEEALLHALIGVVVRSGAVASTVIFGLLVAFFDKPTWFRVAVHVLLGLSIVVAAVSFGLDLFGFSAGASF